MTEIVAREKLEDIIAKGNLEALRQWFAAATEEERRQSAPTAIAWFRKTNKGEFASPDGRGYRWVSKIGHYPMVASQVAVLLTATSEEIDKLTWDHLEEQDIDWNFIRKHRTDALDNFGNTLVAQNSFSFRLVRRLMAKGICTKPTSDQYIVGLIAWPQFGPHLGDAKTLKERLLSAPDFIADDIWRLFEVEGNQESSLAVMDRFYVLGLSWEKTLIQLSEEGIISRDRLLDCSLQALERDFIQFRAGWFSRFHESLRPSPAEKAQRAEAYGKLVGSAIPPTVSFALKALTDIDKVQPLSSDYLQRWLPPALTAKSKSTVTACLSLLEKAVKREPGFSASACLMAADGLLSESAEVQEKAFALIKKYGGTQDQILRQTISDKQNSVAASLINAVQSWLGDTANTEVGQKSIAVPCERYALITYSEPASIETKTQVAPIKNLSELIEAAAFILEHPEQPMECERVIDAVSRLGVERPADFAAGTAALKKRAAKLADSGFHAAPQPQTLMAAFLVSWLNKSGEVSLAFDVTKMDPTAQFLHRRLTAIAGRIANDTPMPLLSAPTHEGGWIDPASFLKRVKHWKAAECDIESCDQIIALLRLPANSVNDLTVLTGGNDSDLAQVLTESLAEGLRMLSSLNGQNMESLEQFAILCQGGNGKGLPINFDAPRIFGMSHELELLKWESILLPRLQGLFFQAGARWASSRIDFFYTSDRALRSFMHSLNDFLEVMPPSGIELIALGLISPDPECAGCARDALIRGIENRCLDVVQVGIQSSILLHSPGNKAKRLAASLSEVGRVSDLHAVAVIALLEETLSDAFKAAGAGVQEQAAAAENKPRDVIALIELLNELLESTGSRIESNQTKEYLKQLDTGGRTAKLVRKLVPV